MDAFDDEFTSVPAAGETIPTDLPNTADPEADFLAREQAELGADLGEEFGLGGGGSSVPELVLNEVGMLTIWHGCFFRRLNYMRQKSTYNSYCQYITMQYFSG